MDYRDSNQELKVKPEIERKTFIQLTNQSKRTCIKNFKNFKLIFQYTSTNFGDSIYDEIRKRITFSGLPYELGRAMAFTIQKD